jgi:hypothetical protein
MSRRARHCYLKTFASIVIVLALVRCAFPHVAGSLHQQQADEKGSAAASRSAAGLANAVSVIDWGGEPHPIRSVPSYLEAFPDTNDLQLKAARRWGVPPVLDRADAEQRKRELVYIGSNPYYCVDPLRQSIPYLVPRAAVLLQDIGQAFFDSLYVKGVPLHKIIVTSVLRSQEDVAKLRRRNGNATENSCHLYGTTFDICYNRYKTVENPDGPHRREVRNDTLKWVLSEVLRDMREQKRCYIKYEVKQGCFHMTVR